MKVICVILCFALLTQLPLYANAASNSTSVPESSIAMIDDCKSNEVVSDISDEEMFSQMLEQLPYDEAFLLKEGLIGPESIGVTTYSTNSLTRSVTATTEYYYETLTMPCAMFYIVVDGWNKISYSQVLYNGSYCYKFSNGNNVIYVNRAAFLPETETTYDRSGTNGSDALISSWVTYYLNSSNTNFYYTGNWRVYNTDGTPRVRLAIYGTKAFKSDNDEIALTYKACIGAGDSSFSHSAAPKYATFTLAIKNTGSGQRYLASMKTIGSGRKAIYGLDISSLVQLGYSSYKFAASTNILKNALDFDSFANIMLTTFDLESSTSTTYSSTKESLSNPALNVYSYSCSARSPYGLTSKGNEFQVLIGLIGSDSTSLEYEVTIDTSSIF